MSMIAEIRRLFQEYRTLEDGWLIIEPKSDEERIVLSGHTNDSVYQIRLVESDEGRILIEGSEGHYGHYGYVDGPMMVREESSSPEEAHKQLESVLENIEVTKPPFPVRTTLNVLADAGAFLISIEPWRLNTGLPIVPHVASGQQDQFISLAEELRSIRLNGEVMKLDVNPSPYLSPSLTSVIAYCEEAIGDTNRVSTKIGAERLAEAFEEPAEP